MWPSKDELLVVLLQILILIPSPWAQEALPNDSPSKEEVTSEVPPFSVPPEEVPGALADEGDERLPYEEELPVEEGGGGSEVVVISLGGGEDEVIMAQIATLLQRQEHSVTAVVYGKGPREEVFPSSTKILEIPLAEDDPLYPEGIAKGVTPGEEGSMEWVSGRVVTSRIKACAQMSKMTSVEKAVQEAKIVVTPLFLHDMCILALAHRLGTPAVGIVTSRLGAWWVWEQIGSLPSLATTPVPPFSVDQHSIWSRAANVAHHYGYVSWVRQQWQVSALTMLPSTWSPPPLETLYSSLAGLLLSWDPLLDTQPPPSPYVVSIGGFNFETGHMTKKVLVPALLNRAGVVTVYSGRREVWIGQEALDALHTTLQTTSYTVVWHTPFPHLRPNVTKDVITSAKFLYEEEVPLNDVLSHPRHRLLISTCGETEVMSAAYFGSPVLCLPVTTDQGLAAAQLARKGVAEVVPAAQATVITLKAALDKLAGNKSYRINGRELGEELHDQPLSASDRLVFTLERIIRKPYSRRFKREGNGLYLLQQSNADVYLLLLLMLTTLLGLLMAIGIAVIPIFLKKQKAKTE